MDRLHEAGNTKAMTRLPDALAMKDVLVRDCLATFRLTRPALETGHIRFANHARLVAQSVARSSGERVNRRAECSAEVATTRRN
jgi:hypothetical protein